MEQPKVMIVLKNGQRWGMFKVKSLMWDKYSNLDCIEVYQDEQGFNTTHYYRNLESNIFENQYKNVQCILIKDISDIIDNIPLKVKYDKEHIIEFNYYYMPDTNDAIDMIDGNIINKKTKEVKSISLSLDEYLSYPSVYD